jgi:hypothetical protein
MGQANNRYRLEPEQFGGLKAGMASNDPSILIDEDGVYETKLLDAASNLPYLALGVGAGIAVAGHKACKPLILKFELMCHGSKLLS